MNNLRCCSLTDVLAEGKSSHKYFSPEQVIVKFCTKEQFLKKWSKEELIQHNTIS